MLSKVARMSSINVDPTTMEPLPLSTGFTEELKRDDRRGTHYRSRAWPLQAWPPV